MNKRSMRVAGFIGSAVATVGLVAFAAAGTGAYFTDTTTAKVKGTAGTIKISDSVASVDFGTLLPGDVVNAATQVKNNGNSPQDVWVKFPAAIAAAAPYADLTVNDKDVLTNGWVKVYGSLAPDATADLNLRIALASSVDNQFNGTIPATLQSVEYTITATQVGVRPDAP